MSRRPRPASRRPRPAPRRPRPAPDSLRRLEGFDRGLGGRSRGGLLGHGRLCAGRLGCDGLDDGRLDRLDGRCDAGRGRLADQLVKSGRAGRGAGLFKGRRLGHLGGHGAELGRIVDLLETDEEGVHLGFVLRDAGLDVLDLALDEGGMAFEAQLELLLALGDALFGLGTDAGDLGLRPVLDAGDVLVGHTPQAVDLFGGSGVDAFDRPSALGAHALEQAAPALFRRRAHRAHEIGQEARWGSRGRRPGGRHGGAGRWARRRGRSIDGVSLGGGRPWSWLSGSPFRRGCPISGGEGGGSGGHRLVLGGHRLVLGDRGAHRSGLLLIRGPRGLVGRVARLVGRSVRVGRRTRAPGESESGSLFRRSHGRCSPHPRQKPCGAVW